MNERIRELAKQAGFEIDNGPLLPGLTTITMKVGGLYVGVPAEKFAELIVKETLQVARAGIEFGDGMEDAVYKYFGIEE